MSEPTNLRSAGDRAAGSVLWDKSILALRVKFLGWCDLMLDRLSQIDEMKLSAEGPLLQVI